MSRNSSGTYSLPAGNPVVTGTTITSTWGNTTMSDIANALTDSLSRTGLGGMSAGLPLADGTASLPGLAWGTELTSGLYRASAGNFRWVVSTTELLRMTTNLVQVSGTTPVLRINESDASANNRLWDIVANAEDLIFRTIDDALSTANAYLSVSRTGAAVDALNFGNATNNPTSTFLGTGSITHNGIGIFAFTPTNSLNATLRVQDANNPIFTLYQSGAGSNEKIWNFVPVAGQLRFRTADDTGINDVNWLEVDRTGTTIDTVNFANGTLQYGGLEVGYRNLIHRSISGSDSTAASDRGRAIQYTGTGGHTLTFDGDLGANHIVVVMNMGNGNLTIAESLGGVLSWMNGSGTISSGSRTLAVGGVATVWYQDASNTFIWGTGIS